MLRLVDWSALPNLKIVYSNEMRRNFVEFIAGRARPLCGSDDGRTRLSMKLFSWATINARHAARKILIRLNLP